MEGGAVCWFDDELGEFFCIRVMMFFNMDSKLSICCSKWLFYKKIKETSKSYTVIRLLHQQLTADLVGVLCDTGGFRTGLLYGLTPISNRSGVRTNETEDFMELNISIEKSDGSSSQSSVSLLFFGLSLYTSSSILKFNSIHGNWCGRCPQANLKHVVPLLLLAL